MKYILIAIALLSAALALPSSWGLFSGALRFDRSYRAAFDPTGALVVPLVSQYQGLATDDVNCGPAAVASIVRALRSSIHGLSDQALVGMARAASGVAGDTNLPELVRALTAAGVPNTALYADDAPGAADPLAAIGYSVRHGSPVLALVNGADLGRGTQYGDHWLVITAVDTGVDEVRVTDADTQQARSPGWIAGGIHWLPAWRMRAALRDASADGTIVALAAGATRGGVPSPRLVLPPLAAFLLLWQARGSAIRMLPRRWRKRLRRWARR